MATTTATNGKFFNTEKFQRIKLVILEYFSSTHFVKTDTFNLTFEIENFYFIEYDMLRILEIKKYLISLKVNFIFISDGRSNSLKIVLK